MNGDAIPRVSRREYQRLLERKRRRLRRRRRARVRRIRVWRTIRSVRFWTRTGVGMGIAAALMFWAKFAFVYDIPAYVKTGPLARVNAYVTVKPWWFGPPVFNLASYETNDPTNLINPYAVLVDNLGRYQAIMVQPDFVWVQKS